MSLSRKLRFVLSFYGLMAEVRVEPYMCCHGPGGLESLGVLGEEQK
jgi:hypothetical protein